MTEQTLEEIAQAMKERPEAWAQIYLDMLTELRRLEELLEVHLRGELS